MTTRIRLTYHGMDGGGATVREAKANARRKLEALVKQAEQTPSIVAVGDCASLVWRFGSYGWCNALVSVHGKPHSHLSPAIPGEASEEEAMARAAMHTAELAWSHDIEDDESFATQALAHYIGKRDLPSKTRELVDRFAWQRRFKSFKDRGFCNNDAHALACGYASPELRQSACEQENAP
jgi:hypothetical protein